MSIDRRKNSSWRRTLLRTLTVALTLFLAPAAAAQHHNRHDPRALAQDPRLEPGQIAPVLEGLGELHHPVTTRSKRAQLFFDQGLKLTYGFNHQEALRAFKEAARLDPDCAMAYWGWALVLGPNLNLPMRPEVVEQAYQAMQMAVARKDKVSPRERDYIDALARRYVKDPQAERKALDQAYAEAMADLHARYPKDDDAATLYAASLMNLTPWDYWTGDARPKYRSVEITLETLESVIERSPRHIGALHYYIHAVEAVDPRRGERAADLLRGLAPGAGHLIHMPSHIYMQVGRFAEAFEDNVKASAADEGYISQCRAQGIYPLNYYPHNLHFLTWAATMLGRSSDAIAAARKVAAHVPHDLHGNDWALYETFLSMPIGVMVRLGLWEELLAEPKPPEERRFWTGMWHFGRGMAWAARNRVQELRAEQRRLQRILNDPATAQTLVANSNAATLLGIANELLSGQLLLHSDQVDVALSRFERAVRLEDGLAYTEPPPWFPGTRRYLAEALARVNRPEEAEVVYWRRLRDKSEDPFALHGLAQALEAQGRLDEAASIRRRFEKAWERADLSPPTWVARVDSTPGDAAADGHSGHRP